MNLEPSLMSAIAFGGLSGIITFFVSGLTAYISVRERLTKLETQMNEIRDALYLLLERRNPPSSSAAHFCANNGSTSKD